MEFSKFLVYKLSTIVSDDCMRDAILAYNILPDELLDLLSCNGC